MDHKTLSDALARREFLKFAGLGTLGLALPELAFARRLDVARPHELLVYVGTYTSGKSEGIYLYRLNMTSGELKHVATTKGVKDPSFLPSLQAVAICTRSTKSKSLRVKKWRPQRLCR